MTDLFSRTKMRKAIEPRLEIISQYADRVFTLFLLFIVAGQLLLATDFNAESRLFPFVVGIPLFLLLGLILLSQSSSKIESKINEFGSEAMLQAGDQMESLVETPGSERAPSEARMQVAKVSLWILFLLVGIYVVGFLWAILGFLLAYYRFQTGQTWVQSAAYTVVMWLVIVVIFVWALNLRFYQGVLGIPHPLPF